MGHSMVELLAERRGYKSRGLRRRDMSCGVPSLSRANRGLAEVGGSDQCVSVRTVDLNRPDPVDKRKQGSCFIGGNWSSSPDAFSAVRLSLCFRGEDRIPLSVASKS